MKKMMRLLPIALVTLAPIAAAQAAPPPPPAPAPPSPPVTMHWSFEMGQGRLGAQVSSMTSELRAFFGAPDDRGILVQKVEPGSVAETSGIAVGDVIVEVDGDAVQSVGDVREALSDRQRGTSVDVVVVRKHKTKRIVAVLDDDPMQLPPGMSFGKGLGPGFDVFRGFGPGGDLDDRLRELEERLNALESGAPPPRPKAPKAPVPPKKKGKAKRAPRSSA